MPYSTRKVRNKSCYRLKNTQTNRVFAKCATKQNIAKQLRLLNAIKYNKDFVPIAQLKLGRVRGGNKTRRLRR